MRQERNFALLFIKGRRVVTVAQIGTALRQPLIFARHLRQIEQAPDLDLVGETKRRLDVAVNEAIQATNQRFGRGSFQPRSRS